MHNYFNFDDPIPKKNIVNYFFNYYRISPLPQVNSLVSMILYSNRPIPIQFYVHLQKARL